MGTRRNFSAEFKAKIALEALVGDKTLAELAAKHDVHPNMIAQWKRHAKESLPDVFAKKTSPASLSRGAHLPGIMPPKRKRQGKAVRGCGFDTSLSQGGTIHQHAALVRLEG